MPRCKVSQLLPSDEANVVTGVHWQIAAPSDSMYIPPTGLKNGALGLLEKKNAMYTSCQ